MQWTQWMVQLNPIQGGGFGVFFFCRTMCCHTTQVSKKLWCDNILQNMIHLKSCRSKIKLCNINQAVKHRTGIRKEIWKAKKDPSHSNDSSWNQNMLHWSNWEFIVVHVPANTMTPTPPKAVHVQLGSSTNPWGVQRSRNGLGDRLWRSSFIQMFKTADSNAGRITVH